MNKIFDALETLYGSSGIPFFLSDEYENIKWKNSACGKVIVFPNGLNGNTSTGQVSVDGTLFAAIGAPFSNGNRNLILWRINTVTDVLMQLGNTDTYTDICYMLSQAKNDIAKAEQNCSDKANLNSIKRNIEVLNELTAVIYHKVPHCPAVYFLEKLQSVIDEANKAMSDIPIVFRINAEHSIENDVPVNISERLFYVCMFSILKAMVRCSDRELFIIKVSRQGSNIAVSSSFTLRSDTHAGMITDDFEMYTAKLYVGYIGGTMNYNLENETGKIEITLPVGDSNSLNSPLYSIPSDTCRKLADVFMSNITDKIE